MAEHSGGCLCGSVRYVAEIGETHFHACHCGMCRRWSGGPVFAASVKEIRFDGAENITRFNSSDWAERGFCKVCGSNLFYRLKEADYYSIGVGTLDDESTFRLAGEIYIDRKPAGYDFAGDHPRLTEAETLAQFALS